MTATAHPRLAAGTVPRFGGFWIRVLAFLVDGLAIGVIVSLVTIGRAGVLTWDHWLELAAWRSFIETVVGFAYFTIFWSAVGGGRTPGMRLFGLKVVGRDGGPIGYGTAVVRWVGVVLSAAAVLIGLVWVAFDPRKQGWHDKLAATLVVHDGADDATAVPAWAGAPVAPRTNATPHPVARGFAVMLGLLGASLGVTGVALALAGDAVVPVDGSLAAVAALTAVAAVGAAVAWIRPSVAAVALGVAALGYWVGAGSLVGPWYDGLLAATAVGPAAETQYWYDAPAMGLLFTGGVFMALGAVVALLGIGRKDLDA